MRKLMEDKSEVLTGIQTHGEDSGFLRCSPSKRYLTDPMNFNPYIKSYFIN